MTGRLVLVQDSSGIKHSPLPIYVPMYSMSEITPLARA